MKEVLVAYTVALLAKGRLPSSSRLGYSRPSHFRLVISRDD